MTQEIPRLSQSVSKARFVELLGLNAPDKQHLYPLMRGEAVSAWQRLQSDRNALLLHLKNNAAVQAPFSSGQICETALHREVTRIYDTASSETRAIYQIAYEPSGSGDNWIIRWCLWHVFRDRDKRNSGRYAGSGSQQQRPVSVSFTRWNKPLPYLPYQRKPGYHMIRSGMLGDSNSDRLPDQILQLGDRDGRHSGSGLLMIL